MEYAGILQMFENGAITLDENGYEKGYSSSEDEGNEFGPLSSFAKDWPETSWDPDEEDDDDELFYNDGLHEMTEEEERQYYDQVHKSGGFDVAALPKVFSCGLIQPWSTSDEDVNSAALEAVNEYNRRYGNDNKGLKLVKVLKAMIQPVAFLLYYLTFEAVDMADAAKIKIYQAIVWRKITDEMIAVSFRLKPIEDEGGNEGNQWFWEEYEGPDDDA